MYAEISVFVVYVEAIMYLSLYDLHDCTFNLICNKVTILNNKNLTKILEVGKSSSYVNHYQQVFVSDKNFYGKSNIGNLYK